MDGLIRKIIIGKNPKDAMAYYIGMNAGPNKVNAIVFDDAAFHKYQIKRYLIYLDTEDGIVLWKSVEDMPVIIEFDLNF